MRYRLFYLSLLLCGWANLTASPSLAEGDKPPGPPPPVPENLPWEPGERLVYKVKWGIISVGVSTLTVLGPEWHEGQWTWHFVQETRTHGIADTLYRVRNRLDSWVPLDVAHSLRYTKLQDEGGRLKQTEFAFSWPNGAEGELPFGTVRYTDHLASPKEIWPQISLLDGTQDPLSVVYAARMRSISVGESFQLPATNGKHPLNTEISVIETDEVKLPSGKFEAVEVEADTKDLGGVFRKSKRAGITFHISDDDQRMPLIIRSKVSVGSFKAYLVAIEKLAPGDPYPSLIETADLPGAVTVVPRLTPEEATAGDERWMEIHGELPALTAPVVEEGEDGQEE